MFLLYSPLNQGLKHVWECFFQAYRDVFTLQSIKSRIETLIPHKFHHSYLGFYSTVH